MTSSGAPYASGSAPSRTRPQRFAETPPRPRAPGDDEPGPREAPREIRIACGLWIVHAVLGAVSGLATLRHARTLVETLARDDPSRTAALTATIMAGLLVGAASLALYVGGAIAMRRGHRWARIVLAVLAALVVASSVYRLATAAGPLITVVAPVQIVLVVAAVALSFRPRASAHLARAPTPEDPVG